MATHGDIQAFAKMISGDELGLVHYQPEADMRPNFCFDNVQRKVASAGGRPRYGWIFLSRRVPDIADAEYLVAIHHTIWNAPDGTMIDVTPFNDDTKHLPVTVNESVLFLLDGNANPLRIRGAMVTLPSRFFAIGDDPALADHVRELRCQEYRKCHDIRTAAESAPLGALIDSNGVIIMLGSKA